MRWKSSNDNKSTKKKCQVSVYPITAHPRCGMFGRKEWLHVTIDNMKTKRGQQKPRSQLLGVPVLVSFSAQDLVVKILLQNLVCWLCENLRQCRKKTWHFLTYATEAHNWWCNWKWCNWSCSSTNQLWVLIAVDTNIAGALVVVLFCKWLLDFSTSSFFHTPLGSCEARWGSVKS